MKRIFWVTISIITCIVAMSQASAQRVSWACRVIESSPAFFSKTENYPGLQAEQFAASQALGKPTVFPGAGLNPAAWTTSKHSSAEFIHVAFCDSLAVRQIIIVETLRPGTISRITGYDDAGNIYDLGSFDPIPMRLPSRVAHIFLEHSLMLTSIRIELNASIYGKSLAIDAIGMSDSPVPVMLGLMLPAALNPKLKSAVLPQQVNSSVRELNPVMTPDRNLLFFSRAFDPQNEAGENDPEDVWVSRRHPETGEWEQALHMDSILNTRGPNFISSIHARGDTTVFLMGNRYEKNKVTAGVSMFLYHDGTWSDAINLNVPDFYNYSDEGNFYLSINDSVLLLSLMRDDTFGSRDLYVSFLTKGNWSSPMNLGSVINTVATDATPYLSEDLQMLYFSSDGHSGLGGADIFVSERLDNTWLRWSPPQNLGQRVNTAADEFGLTLYAGKGHFIRGMESNTDIIELTGSVLVKKYPSLKTLVRTISTSGTPLSCEIKITPVTGVSLKTDSLGQLLVNTRPETKYSFKAEHDGYETTYKDTTFSGENEITEVLLRLKPIEQAFEELMNLEIVYFDFDKSDLKPEFHPYLDRVADYLVRQQLSVELFGHTDAMGTEGYNQPLSIRRATAVREYLLDQGVPEKQITLYGFGEMQPAHPNATPSGQDNEQGRKMNRRVEFKLMAVKH